MGKAVLLLVLALPGCALAQFSTTPEGQPVYVLGNPLCLIACSSNLGTARSGGDAALSQSAGAAAGVVP